MSARWCICNSGTRHKGFRDTMLQKYDSPWAEWMIMAAAELEPPIPLQ